MNGSCLERAARTPWKTGPPGRKVTRTRNRRHILFGWLEMPFWFGIGQFQRLSSQPMHETNCGVVLRTSLSPQMIDKCLRLLCRLCLGALQMRAPTLQNNAEKASRPVLHPPTCVLCVHGEGSRHERKQGCPLLRARCLTNRHSQLKTTTKEREEIFTNGPSCYPNCTCGDALLAHYTDSRSSSTTTVALIVMLISSSRPRPRY